MSNFSADNHRYMACALQLAERGLYTTYPNPRVGCVIVKNGSVIGEGWHQRAGEAHAEIHALQSATGSVQGATVYVTLEPCAHKGRTGPCTEALIAAGVARVVCAMEDPNPQVAGAGLARLQSSGIETACGLMQAEARKLNRGFLSRVERQRPFVRLKLATSLDGATAMTSGESQWITGEAARRDVQRWRAQSDAIVTGVGTVLADNPRLTVRDVEGHDRQPMRVVLDSHARMPADAALLADDGETLVFSVAGQTAGKLVPGATLIEVDGQDGRCRLDRVLAILAEREINEVLLECGPILAGSFLAADLVDELLLYQAPVLLGSDTRRTATTPLWQTLAEGRRLQIHERRQFGPDLRIIASSVAQGADPD